MTAARDPAPAAPERCAEERRRADERCELATRARAQADAAVAALRSAQRAYDEHEAAAVTASWRADPRAIHEAKDTAQAAFRAAVGASTDSDALETAARDWLNEINRINIEARDAAAKAAAEHAAAAAIGATLERLSLEADSARKTTRPAGKKAAKTAGKAAKTAQKAGKPASKAAKKASKKAGRKAAPAARGRGTGEAKKTVKKAAGKASKKVTKKRAKR